MVLLLKVTFHLSDEEILDLTFREVQKLFEMHNLKTENETRALTSHLSNGVRFAFHSKDSRFKSYISQLKPLEYESEPEKNGSKPKDTYDFSSEFERLGMGKRDG